MEDENKRSINYIPVDEDTFAWLKQQANQAGELISHFAGAVLDSASVDWQPTITDDQSDDSKLFWKLHEIRKQKKRRDTVYRAAAIYKERPDEQTADTLSDMCEWAGLDYAEVMNQVENDPFSSIIAQSRNGTKFGSCVRWLPAFISDHNGEVAVTPLRIVASNLGYSNSMLDRVKAAINNDIDTPSIVSVKSGKNWVWRVEEMSHNFGEG